MHIPDGLLPLSICAVGYGATPLMLRKSFKELRKAKDFTQIIPKISMVTAAFFIGTLINIPFPPTSIHPLLVGVSGVILGVYAPLSIFISLLFQAILFKHGGITTLGVNTFIFSLPALICYWSYNKIKIRRNQNLETLKNFIIGSLSTLLSVLIYSLLMATYIPSYYNRAAELSALIFLIIAHIPLVLVEGLLFAFLLKSKKLQSVRFQNAL